MPATVAIAAGHAALAAGDWAAAARAFAEAADLAVDAATGATARANQASALRLAGDIRGAVDCYRATLAQRTAAGLPLDAAFLLNLARAEVALGAERFAAGDHRGARESWAAAAPLLAAHAHPEEAAALALNLAGLCYLLGDVDEAADHLAAAPPQEAPLLRAQLHANRGLVHLARSEFPEARADLEAAAAAFATLQMPRDEAGQWAALSDSYRVQGALPEAIACHQRAMALEHAHGFRVQEPGGLLYAPQDDRSLGLPPRHIKAPAAPAPAAAGRRPFLLIVPPAWGMQGPVFPRGAVSIASFLEAHGVPAEVLPLAWHVDDFAGRSAALAQTRAVLADAIAALRPRAVGLSVPFTYLFPRAAEIAALLRELDPSLFLVAGGPHVTFLDRESLREAPALDAIARGEGEWTALDLARALEAGGDLSGVRGLTWRAPDGTLVRNPPRPLGALDRLPPLDFSCLPEGFVRAAEISAVTSRGCAHRCRFCHERTFWRGQVRFHAPEGIRAELDLLAARYGNRLRGIDDSMLTMGTPYFHRLLELLATSPNLPEDFGFLTRLDTIDAGSLRAMTAAGLRLLSVGAESGSQRVLEAMGKDLRLETVEHALGLCRDAGVRVNAYPIVGHPGDDPQQAAGTRAWVDDLFTSGLVQWIDLSIFTPYPGTVFYREPARHGVEILSRDWSLWRRSNRPVAQQPGYPASAVYLDYLRMLDVQARHITSEERASR
ncbi:MAG: radical SAM protein [Pseudomonadota bacterium]